MEIFGFIVIIIAFGLIFLVMRENSYALKTIGIQKGQKSLQQNPMLI
jgi:hypothetical protein